ncbi:MAG: hypothetical protein AB2A00_07385 [Myxococcota bacterium]
MRLQHVARALVLVAAGFLVVTGVRAAPAGFWQHWGDGKAELTGYTLTQSRYGEQRKGQAVAIYVTEPFSNSARVKADPGRHPPDDEFQAVKLNLVEDFQTGVYDYNVMTSAWVRVEAGHGQGAFAPVKLSFSAQEWCGHVFESWWFLPGGTARFDRHSYFDGEADESGQVELRNAIFVDHLFLAVRGLGPVTLHPGQTVKLDVVPRLKTLRLLHKPAQPEPATFTRSGGGEKLSVPAGAFDVEKYTLTMAQGGTMHWWVERAEPRKVIAWEHVGQDRAEMTGSFRDPYWQHHNHGDEALLKKLGLKPLPQ